MKKVSLIISAALLACGSMFAQNKANFTLTNGTVDSYNTDELNSVEFNADGSVVVNPVSGTATTYSKNLSKLSFVKNQAGHVVITEAGGWFEATYVKWENLASATDYRVYVKPEGGSYTQIDSELVRNYGATGRADMVGLTAGTYVMKVVPVVGGIPNDAMASETSPLEVRAHIRAGFAHYNFDQGVGAYNNDGTLKTGAKIIYVNANNAKTVTTDVVTSSKGAVTTGVGFQDIINLYQKGYDTTPIAFRIVGRLTEDDCDELMSSAEGLQIKGRNADSILNITIEGIGDDATIHGFGILIRNSASVEIRNLGFMAFKDDGISIDTDNAHLWVHNCDIFYGSTGGASDQAKGDGSLDTKSDSKYSTFSFNHFWDSGKCNLCGMKSESGPNYLTYHHNWYDHSDSRHPRVRTMSVHIYNNYFDGNAKYGAGATTGADLFVENNYFRNCKNPVMTSMQGTDIASDGTGTFSGEDGGSIKCFGNIMCGKYYYRPWSETNTVEFDAWEAPTRDAQVPSSVVAKQGGDTYSNWDTNASLMYSYTPDAAADVPTIVKGVYGAGRINHGDFHWTFNNNIEDANYDVIAKLKAEIVAYDSYLVGYYTGETSIGNGGVGSERSGGDATEGAEFPNGNGNAATGSVSGGGSDPSVEVGDVFIGTSDGGYMTFGADSTDAVNALIADGTLDLTGSTTHQPNFTNNDYWAGNAGSLQIAKSGGYLIIKCPSIATFKMQSLRTGTFKTSIQVSTDGGKTYNEMATDTSNKGVSEKDFSAQLQSNSEVYVKIVNNSTGGLNIIGLAITLVK